MKLLGFYRRHLFSVLLGILLALLTLVSSLFLLSLSGWFLAASAAAGFVGLTTFNYVVPAVCVRGCAILRTAGRYAERLISHNTTFKILAHLRALSFKKIITLSPLQWRQYQKADLLNRFIADIDTLDHFYLKMLSPAITALVGIIIIYFSLSPFNLTLAKMIVLILFSAALLLPLSFFSLSRSVSHNVIYHKNAYRRHIITYLEGNTELCLFGAQKTFRHRLNQIGSEWLAQQEQQACRIHLAQSLVMAIIGLLTVVVIVVAAHLHWNYHSPILALFVFVVLAATELLTPLATAFIYLGEVIAAATRIRHLLHHRPAVSFPSHGRAELCQPFTLRVNQLGFCYPGQSRPVLHNINFNMKAGQHLAIIGKTGAGKSTLLQLLTRMADPNTGSICCNQIPITEFNESSLRKMITMVPQRIDILSDTLANNLRIADPKATNAALISLLRQVELDKLLENEDGLDLWIGEQGRALSGGEIRRIGIARALLSNAPFIIMDEPTESLDTATEENMVNLIKKLGQNKSLLIVTHRLLDKHIFDRRYLLNEGTLNIISY